MIRAACLLYGILGVVGSGLILWRSRNGHFDFDPFTFSGQGWLIHSAACLALIAGIHLLSIFAVKRFSTVAKSARDIKSWLGEYGKLEILALALVSGLVEEILFRGWLLNEIGLLFSSALFGLAHIPPNRNWRLWPFFAFLMGLILGSLCLWTGSIYFAVAAHAAINYLNISRLDGQDPPIAESIAKI